LQSPPIVLELAGVSKTFGGVEALRQVDFALCRGEIHGAKMGRSKAR
jgi:ABC-type sugar transport system ATPase subunit